MEQPIQIGAKNRELQMRELWQWWISHRPASFKPFTRSKRIRDISHREPESYCPISISRYHEKGGGWRFHRCVACMATSRESGTRSWCCCIVALAGVDTLLPTPSFIPSTPSSINAPHLQHRSKDCAVTRTCLPRRGTDHHTLVVRV